MLKVLTGPLEVIGTVVLPGLAMLGLILVPFIDRHRMVKVTQRTVAFGFVALAATAWSSLTVAAILTTPKPQAEPIDYSLPTDWLKLTPDELAGAGYFRQEACGACHSLGDGPRIGPDLARPSRNRNMEWMMAHFRNPAAVRLGTSMPAVALNNAQLRSVAAFLLRIDPTNASGLRTPPDFAVAGAIVYQANRCPLCHSVNGAGAATGPSLNGLATRRNRSWVEQHFSKPAKLSPGTTMPPYRLERRDLDNLTAYLFSLPER
jgi:cbb3-type cytochrome oxidase cytochrome c subunit